MFSAAPNELSRFKLDVHRNMARYVLSYSKPFGLLPKTLPHSSNVPLRSQENSNLKSKSSIKTTSIWVILITFAK